MILFFLLFQACSSAEQTYNFGGKEEATDATISFGESDADIVFDTPIFTIPPYTEKMHCYFLTYDGPDVAVVSGSGTQNAEFGHHVLPALSSMSEDAYPDGDVVDCTEKWVDAEPMIEVTELAGDGTFSFDLQGKRAQKDEQCALNP